MCGIAGVLAGPSMDGERVTHAVGAMTARLGHRGPDDSGTVVLDKDFGTLALGHTRLSILDPSPAGHQPMPDRETGNLLVHNGEIYNFKKLRSLLPEPWRSQSDTEVVLKAYRTWGTDGVERLRGMFAFALWDEQKRRLFLARDRLGIKPLYYYKGDGCFVFASEVRAVLASGLVPGTLDPAAVDQYLTYQSVPAPRTLVQGVRALFPGWWMSVDEEGRVQESCYWDALGAAVQMKDGPGEVEARERVRELLLDAVSHHMVSDVPVAAFLSGGIDSSAVVALMREVGQMPRTFSVVFSESNYDEGQYSRRVAGAFATDHTEITLEEKDLLDHLPDALGAMDQPSGDAVNTYLVASAVASRGLKVAQSGLGGDELFGGYPSSRRLTTARSFLRLWGSVPSALRRSSSHALRLMGGESIRLSKIAAILAGDGSLARTYPVLRQLLPDSARVSLLNPRLWSSLREEDDPYVELLMRMRSLPESSVLSSIAYAEARTYMHDVLLRDTDQMSMAHGLEVRVPLLDHALVEYVLALPDQHKRANGVPKRLLVESLNARLPREIVQRPKRGFTLPFDPWMRTTLREFCEERLSQDRVRARGLFRPEAVDRLWQEFLNQRPGVTWSRLWILVVLEEWLTRNELNLPRELAA